MTFACREPFAELQIRCVTMYAISLLSRPTIFSNLLWCITVTSQWRTSLAATLHQSSATVTSMQWVGLQKLQHAWSSNWSQICTTHKYGPYIRAVYSTQVHFSPYGCQKMHPYMRAINTAHTYGLYLRVVRYRPLVWSSMSSSPCSSCSDYQYAAVCRSKTVQCHAFSFSQYLHFNAWHECHRQMDRQYLQKHMLHFANVLAVRIKYTV